MRSFSELLTEYTRRAGISDSELARSIGVRRQTIFRWKEGVVSRPRHRDDVLALAKRLRLTPEERDELLLAAGFRPEAQPQASPAPIPAQETAKASERPAPAQPSPAQPAAAPLPQASPGEEEGRSPRRAWLRARWKPLALGGAVLLLLVLAGIGVTWWRNRPRFPLAAPGETLVVVAPFANYTGGQQGFNVAGRLQTALVEETERARLQAVRVALWPQVLQDEAQALAALEQASATLLIWGEYDSGRVLAHITLAGSPSQTQSRELEALVASPGELSTTINSELPQDVRYLALLSLGELYLQRQEFGLAQATLERARANAPQDDPRGLAALYFRMGYAYQMGEPPDLAKAIDVYSRAIELDSRHARTYYNRGLAYLHRGKASDLGAAIQDFDQAIRLDPGYAPAYTSRAVAFLLRKREGDLERALVDLNQAIELAPDQPLAYFNRGLLFIRMDNREGWVADLTRLVELAPDFADGYGALCWGYVLDQEPEAALPLCEQAITLGSSVALSSRGMALAQLGEYSAAAVSLRQFLKWLDEQPADNPYQRYREQIQEWVQVLEEEERNPLDEELLARLRLE